ncbi:MAG: hypothetical protein ACKOAX_01105, partial [Candidatus Kapaibacterium sp.]
GRWVVEILDMQGRLHRSMTTDVTDHCMIVLSLRDEPAGTYGIRLTSGSRQHVVTVTRRP